jgi:hypothetical protein
MWQMQSLRLAFCDRPPFAVWNDGSPAGAWLSVTADIATDRGFGVEYVMPEEGCDVSPQVAILKMLTGGLADVGVYPFIFNVTTELARAERLTAVGSGLVSLYPIENGSPVFLSRREPADAVRLFTDPFSSGAWFVLVAIAAVSIVASIAVDVRGHPWRRVAHTAFAFFGSAEVTTETTRGVRVIYIWLTAMSMVLVTLYTSIMAQILLLSESEIDNYSRSVQRDEIVSVTRDISDQLKFSRSPFNQVLSTNFTVVDERDALASLPILTSWPVSTMLRQMTCSTLDLAYQEISKVSYGMLAVADAPPWLYGDVRDAVFDRRFPNAAQKFVEDAPFCPTVPEPKYEQLAILAPAAYIAAVFLAAAWIAQIVQELARRRRDGRAENP